jgi:hypothetical protein
MHKVEENLFKTTNNFLAGFHNSVPSSLARKVVCAGIVRQKKGKEDAAFYLAKDGIFFPPFLANEPGTGNITFCV